MPKGACSCRVSRAVIGAMGEVSGKTQLLGLASFTWAQGAGVYSFESSVSKMAREMLRCSFWMPEGACNSRVSRALNRAMVEVSGKTEHSHMAGVTWEQGRNVCSFDGRRWAMDSEPLCRTKQFLNA